MGVHVPGLAFIWMLSSLLISLLLVRGAIAYALKKGMLDHPGQRRSHSLPTPRGGGIGIVIAALFVLPLCLSTVRPAVPLTVIVSVWVGLALVAMIGWSDDHRPLPVLPRLATQAMATMVVILAMAMQGLPWWWAPLLLLAGLGSINIHNFMDGIDGLLAQQAIFVFSGMALLGMASGEHALGSASATLASACLGFWVYNRPPARIFMGDVGSGSIGYLIFAVGALIWLSHGELIWPLAILSCTFITDSTLTLLVRVWRGRRWYSAHREHLYQWLVRRGATHRRVTTSYLMWNVFVSAPLSWLAWLQPRFAVGICLASYLAAAVIWVLLKQVCLRRSPHRVPHVST